VYFLFGSVTDANLSNIASRFIVLIISSSFATHVTVVIASSVSGVIYLCISLGYSVSKGIV